MNKKKIKIMDGLDILCSNVVIFTIYFTTILTILKEIDTGETLLSIALMIFAISGLYLILRFKYKLYKNI